MTVHPHYQNLQLVASGAYGSVYKAVSAEDGKHYALKQLDYLN